MYSSSLIAIFSFKLKLNRSERTTSQQLTKKNCSPGWYLISATAADEHLKPDNIYQTHGIYHVLKVLWSGYLPIVVDIADEIFMKRASPHDAYFQLLPPTSSFRE